MKYILTLSLLLLGCSPTPVSTPSRPDVELISIRGCDYIFVHGIAGCNVIHLANCTNHIANRITYELK